MEQLDTTHLTTYVDTAVDLALRHGPRLLLAIIVLVGGMWLVNKLIRTLEHALVGRAVEPTLGRFLSSLASVTLKALLLISVGSMIGIETTSFIAMLGAAGLAVGLALQGSLANFAGGVLILLFRPFRVGDGIEALGVAGTVGSITILHTIVKTADNKVIIVPNGPLANAIVTNVSAESERRIDLVFSIGYGDDIARAKSVMLEVATADPRVLRAPPPAAVVSALTDTAVKLTIRFWVRAADYADASGDLLERIKLAFDGSGISIPLLPTAPPAARARD